MGRRQDGAQGERMEPEVHGRPGGGGTGRAGPVDIDPAEASGQPDAETWPLAVMTQAPPRGRPASPAAPPSLPGARPSPPSRQPTPPGAQPSPPSRQPTLPGAPPSLPAAQ